MFDYSLWLWIENPNLEPRSYSRIRTHNPMEVDALSYPVVYTSTVDDITRVTSSGVTHLV